MKTTFALLAVAGVAMSQELSSLPECGQTCISNMINIAQTEFDCAAGDALCYCANADFGYGVRDCSNEACGVEDAAPVIAYGNNYCAQALASATTGAAGASETGALPVLSSALESATVTDDDAASTPISTSALVGTVTSDGSTFETTTGFSTIYGGVGATGTGASSAIASVTSSAGSALSSAAASASSVASSLASEASSAASAASSLAESASSAASTATGTATETETETAGATATETEGAAPMLTAVPMAGFAGIAAMLFL